MICGPGPEHGHEAALELVSGVNFVCVLNHFASPTRWNGSRGQVRPENGPKPAKTKIKIIISIAYREVFFIRPKSGPEMIDFWGLAGPGGPGNPSKRWGAKPPLAGGFKKNCSIG